MTPRATYRLQFHKDFTFADAREIVPYLDRLGISHIYASPITTARYGSTHGYDVTDPTQVNPELGGEEGLRALADTLVEHDMGLIVDIVPNHMGVAGGENPWWQDVLENGERSAYAHFFDIDWRAPLMLPVLGAPLEEVIAGKQLRLAEAEGRLCLQLYGETLYPLRPDDPVHFDSRAEAFSDHDPDHEQGRIALSALAIRQHYRLAYWRTANDLLNWRRFFSINDLAGLRAEDPGVFEATHALVLRLYADGLIDGVRVDHIDGLSDPAAYCRRLATRLMQAGDGRKPYLVVEKILAPGETLPTGWDIDGTSGYDFMRQAAALLHDPAGRGPLAALWSDISGRPADFEKEERLARRQLLSWQFEGQLTSCAEHFVRLAASEPDLAWIPPSMLRRAIERLLWVFPVYRTYGTGTSSPPEDTAVRETARRRAAEISPPGEDAIADIILAWLEGDGPGAPELRAEAVRRFQQLSAPIAAKAVEDTAFYRHGVLLSANEVGSDPGAFSMAIEEFHAAMEHRSRMEPNAMLALATHDHKRGADARARLAVLAGVPDLWAERLRGWLDVAGADDPEIAPGDVAMLLQTLVGMWDDSATRNASAFLTRLHGWQQKALREAKLHSSWVAPDEAYEARYEKLAHTLLTDERHQRFRDEFARFRDDIAPAALANSLAQTALQLTGPGVPDIYQGTELADYSLVDPDNRRPVNYAARQQMLAHEEDVDARCAKLRLVTELLGLRRAHPALFAQGDYRPLHVSGQRADHIVAFARRHEDMHLTCAVAIRLSGALVGSKTACPTSDWWGDTWLETHTGGRLSAAEAFESSVISYRIEQTRPLNERAGLR